ncbi:MAG: DUF1592 domain-containing protein [Oligoflexales bacterium]|nr:DUF1592 domain-containing protein [Oligoflexales bacterium]
MKDHCNHWVSYKLLIKLTFLGLTVLIALNCKKKSEQNPVGIPAEDTLPNRLEEQRQTAEANEFLSSPFFLFFQTMEENCVGCHNASGLASSADFTILESEADWVNSDYVQAGSPEESSIYFRLTGSRGDLGPKNMPTGGSLSEEQLSIVSNWISHVSAESASSQSVDSILDEIMQQSAGEQTDDVCTIEMPPQRIWRIARQQYLNIITDVFSLDVSDAIGDLSDPSGIGIPADPAGTLSISAERMNTIFTAIEETSERLLSNSEVIACVESSDMACVINFIDKFGPILWRRPLTPEENDSLSNLFSQQLGERNSRQEAMKILLESLLISTEFWYRDELGISTTGGLFELDDFELAEFLAFTIWDSIPDAELHTLANEQRLKDQTVMQGQIRRMAEDPRGLRGIRHFIDEWLDLSQVLTVNKDSDSYPEFDSNLRTHLWDESMGLISSAWSQNQSVFSLFATDQFLGASELSGYYETTTDPSGNIQHAANQRMGILTSGAFLASHSKAQSTGMPLRGAYFLEEILCSPLPPVPADISADAASGSFTTTREFFENTHANRPECSSCHTILDPVGASFEHYDPIGKYRTLENGYPINASGDLSIAGEQFVFQNATELIQQVIVSPKFSKCLVDRYLTYALGWHLQETDCLTSNNLPSSDLKLKEVANFLERVPSLQTRSQTTNSQEQ